MSQIHIRKGVAADMPQVHQLVYELSVYEQAPHEVHTSPEQYVQDGFGEHPLFECFVAENEEGRIVGIAFFYFGYSTWKGKKLYLDDLIVTEAYRRKGVGMKLFDRLVRYAAEQGAQQMRWHVLDWNEPAIEFYKKIDAELDPEWITCKLSAARLKAWAES
ncbi:MAG: GNAT family N-acetyltransferase [Bacteroidetes bacterium]|nr:MAG: GNAT family N-acetyltransferase [Bacteroidota bacterium]